MSYQDGNHSSNYVPQPVSQAQGACDPPADRVIGVYVPPGLLYDAERRIYLEPYSGQIFRQAGAYGVVPVEMLFYDNIFYDYYGNVLSEEQVFSRAHAQYYQPPVRTQERKKIEITRPAPEAVSVVSAINAPALAMTRRMLGKDVAPTEIPEISSSSWEVDEIIDVPEDTVSHNATNAEKFGGLSHDKLRNKCAKYLALALNKNIDSVHVVLSSDRSSVCSVFYNREKYIVDTFNGDVYNALPDDFNLVGRAVLPRDNIELKDGKLTFAGKIVVSHVLNARDENFTLNDFFEDGPCRLGSFHYHKEKGSGIVPDSKSYSVRGSVVDLKVGVVICGSYGWTPVAVRSKIDAKDGKFVIRSREENKDVENVFSVSDINAIPVDSVDKPQGSVTISPYIEGTLVRVYLSYGRMFVSSHSKIDISKSKYRDVFLSQLFAQYGLTKEDLFPGDYLHSNFHYSFIIRDKALVSSSRFPLGYGSLAYLGVMYNYNSDEEYCPYDVADVISTPVNIGDMGRIRNTPITTNARMSYDVPHIFVPRPFKNLKDVNDHLVEEFGSLTSDCEGSVIIMQKDSLGLYTNIVRVAHPRAENRMRFIEGQNDTEAFLKHIGDLDVDNDVFRSKYPLYPVNIPLLKGRSEATSFTGFVEGLKDAISFPYLTSEMILAFMRKNKDHYNINAVPSREMRLRIIALTFITCLPPQRQMQGIDVYSNYLNFLANANRDFNRYRRFISEESVDVQKKDKFGVLKTHRGALSALNEKLSYLEEKPVRESSGKPKGAKGGKKLNKKPIQKKPPTSRKEIRINFRDIGVESIINYYRLHNKLLKRWKFVSEQPQDEDI